MKCPQCKGTGVIDDALYVFGGRVRARRRKLGMHQKELATRAGLNQSFISRIEGGGALPNIEKARAIADALGSTPAKLVYPKEKAR